MAFQHSLSTNNYGPAKFIVATSAANGTHTTLAGALADASSGDVIFMRDSVTEDVTLKAGVTITAFPGSARASNVAIIGNATASFAGSCVIAGVKLQGAPFLTVSGSADTIVYVEECFLRVLAGNGIAYSSSSANSKVQLTNCFGNIADVAGFLYTQSSPGTVEIYQSEFSNSASSTNPATSSAGLAVWRKSYSGSQVQTTSTAILQMEYTEVFVKDLNIASVVHNGTGANSTVKQCQFSSGTATVITCGSGATLQVADCFLATSNGTRTSGAGTITIISSEQVATSYATGSGTATPVSTTGVLTIAGGGTITTSGSGSTVTITGTGGAVTTAFLGYLASTVNNVTGTGTSFNLGTTTALTEVFDIGNDFNTNGTFTAPSTGKYLLSVSVRITGATTCTSVEARIASSNATYSCVSGRPSSGIGTGASVTFLCDMDAADTAFANLASFGESSDTDDVVGSGTRLNAFSGYLVV